MTVEASLRRLYDAFNKRDIETVLAELHPEVNWPNAWEGGRLHGVDAVRGYWTRQWAAIDPTVTPLTFRQEPDGGVAVQVRAIVRDKTGNVVADHLVDHVYWFENGLISRMDVRESAER